MNKSSRKCSIGTSVGRRPGQRHSVLTRCGATPERVAKSVGGRAHGNMRRTPTVLSVCALLAVWLFAFGAPAGAAVVMETNGSVTSIGVPKGEGQSAQPGEPGAQGGNPPSTSDDVQNTTVYPSLPWGIVPEVHIAWPPHEWGGGQRPSRPPHWNGGGQRPPHGGNWQRPPHGGNWQRPPHGSGERPPHGDGWQGHRPGQSMGGAGGQGMHRPGTGSPGYGPPPQMVRPPVGSAHIPGGGRPGGSSVLLPPGR